MASLDPEVVRHALQVARERGFAEVEIGHEESAFYARLEPTPKKKRLAGSAEPSVDDAPSEPENKPLKATLVGYYIPAPSPLTVGATVQKGEIIGVISALGIANDVEASVSGEVLEVLVKDGDPVEYGQALAVVKPQ